MTGYLHGILSGIISQRHPAPDYFRDSLLSREAIWQAPGLIGVEFFDLVKITDSPRHDTRPYWHPPPGMSNVFIIGVYHGRAGSHASHDGLTRLLPSTEA